MNRKEALSAGEPTYVAKAPCAKGHAPRRYTSSGACVECVKGYAQDKAKEYKASRAAVGSARLVEVKDWVHPDDADLMRQTADALRQARNIPSPWPGKPTPPPARVITPAPPTDGLVTQTFRPLNEAANELYEVAEGLCYNNLTNPTFRRPILGDDGYAILTVALPPAEMAHFAQQVAARAPKPTRNDN